MPNPSVTSGTPLLARLRRHASPDLARKLPRYPSVPAVLIGWLGRDASFRGQHVGSMLLADAITQRQKIFAHAAEKGYLVAGAHVFHPGIGRLSREGSGYRWWPLRYVDDAVTR